MSHPTAMIETGRSAGEESPEGVGSPFALRIALLVRRASLYPVRVEEDFDEIEDEDESRQPLILVHQITAELKTEYVALIADGLDPGSAARELGSTGSQFRKFRSPNSQWYDPAFADQVEAAKHGDQRKANLLERLEEAVWKAIEDGNIRMLEKMLYAYHPDFEKLRHTNLRVSGEIVHAAKVLLPHLSDEEIQARLADIEAKEGNTLRLLPPAPEEKA